MVRMPADVYEQVERERTRRSAAAGVQVSMSAVVVAIVTETLLATDTIAPAAGA
jgi:hypothetical protein